MNNKDKAQSVIEFCFASVVLMMLLLGMVQTVRWVMLDLAERRYDHEAVLTSGSNDPGVDASSQLNPYFHRPRPIDAALFRKGN